MKTFFLVLFSLLITTFHGSCTFHYEQYDSNQLIEPLVPLNGKWKFNIGDDENWAKQDYDDALWDTLFAPTRWQDQGYVGYFGYAWYRRTVTIEPTNASDQLYLSLGKIDDVSEVYFNGKFIGQTGSFPPEYETAYNIDVLYPIPNELIQFNGPNTIAIRVFDEGRDGGIISGFLSIGYYADEHLLSHNLSGDWKISFDFNHKYLEGEYNDNEWLPIFVPASWESQGFSHFDGTATYRKVFKLNGEITGQQYLILGKIDDKDRVYLNGHLIGKTEDMYKTALSKKRKSGWSIGIGQNSNWQDGGDYELKRAYRIPSELLNTNGKNTLVVVVEDFQGNGGIYEGPVGIMTEENCMAYIKEHRQTVFYKRFEPFL